MSSPGQLDWLKEAMERPARRFANAALDRLQPLRKPHVAKILPNVAGVRTDEQLQEFLDRNRDSTVLVNFGSSWCAHCHQMFPHFLSLTKRFPQLKYAVAQVDYMHEAVRGITYTPTFAVYKGGRKVDQFFGANEQLLSDHVWLQSQAVPEQQGQRQLQQAGQQQPSQQPGQQRTAAS